jgi:hypothetical protein
MVAAVALQGTQMLTQAVNKASDLVSVDVTQRLRQASAAYVGFARHHHGHFRAMFGSGLEKTRYPELLATAQGSLASITSLLVEWARTNGLSGLDITRLTVDAWTIVHGVAALLVDGAFTYMIKNVEAEDLAGDLISAHLEGVIATTPKPN